MSKKKKPQRDAPKSIDENARLKIPSSVISRRNQDGTIVLMKIDDASAFYKIDGTAAEVWRCFESPQSIVSITEHFSELQPSKAKTLGREIKALVGKFMSYDLLAITKNPLGTSLPAAIVTSPKQDGFGTIKEFNLESIESEVLNDSVYLDVFAGSDLRLKSDVAPIQGALSKVLQLDGITHRWNDDAPVPNPEATRAGLIAQQVAAQMPELVRRDAGTGILAVDYQKLSSYLVEAIKDLNGIIAKQEIRIRSLEDASSKS